MSTTGCGHPVSLGNGVVTCGTRVSTALLIPILCLVCQGTQALRAAGFTEADRDAFLARRAPRTPEDAPGATCEGCREVPAVRTSPTLCAGCYKEYQADMIVNAEIERAQHDARCRCRGCGRG